MTTIAVTPMEVGRVLRALRNGIHVTDSPLLSLLAVSQQLREDGLPDTPHGRSTALKKLLHRVIETTLLDLRSPFSIASAVPPASSGELLQRDFTHDNSVLESWSALYFAFFVVESRTLIAKLKVLKVNYGRFNERVNGGFREVAEKLQETEHATHSERDKTSTTRSPQNRHTSALRPHDNIAQDQHRVVVVGRDLETRLFRTFVQPDSSHWILNVFGPGGIGKSVVARTLLSDANTNRMPLALVDMGFVPPTGEGLLHSASDQLAVFPDLSASFESFLGAANSVSSIRSLMHSMGSLEHWYSPRGVITNESLLLTLVADASLDLSDEMLGILRNRFALDRYMRNADQGLTQQFSEAVKTASLKARRPIGLILDTYENIEVMDDWILHRFVPALSPRHTRLVILGRNRLSRVNFEWTSMGTTLHEHELGELSRDEAMSFLRAHGADNDKRCEDIVSFTGGYPLLLVLVAQLAREAGGWDSVGGIESTADREWVASRLLDRILEEEKVRDVRAFLEKGALVRWFNVAVVAQVLQIDEMKAHDLYHRLRRHSFVERHPHGLKFHDKIRELLLTRLMFNSSQYEHERARLIAWYQEQVVASNRPQPDIS